MILPDVAQRGEVSREVSEKSEKRCLPPIDTGRLLLYGLLLRQSHRYTNGVCACLLWAATPNAPPPATSLSLPHVFPFPPRDVRCYMRGGVCRVERNACQG